MTDNELAFLRDDPEMADLFLAEALDHLGTIEAALLALDDRPGDVTLLNDIFRPFHTIKGNAGALGVTSVQEVAHRVENLLDLARSGRRPMGPADVDVVLRAVDVLTSMIRDIGVRLSGQPGADLAPVARALIASVDMLISGESETHEKVPFVRRAVQLSEVPVASVLEAANGKEALAVLDANDIDALFTDINMPVMSGPELLRELERQGRSTPARIVVSTDGSDARRQEMEGLARWYVNKPVRPEVVRDVLNELASSIPD